MERLLLWDIDGTLMWGGGSGERALTLAMQECFALQVDMAKIDYSGRTDVMIGKMLFEAFGVEETADSLQHFLECYLKNLREQLAQSSPTILPGVAQIVETVHACPHLDQALLTGNLARGAEAKLGHVGLWHHFAFGAFADHSHDRNALAHHALERAREHHAHPWEPRQVYVIGDTPHDVACGRAIAARTIAVATGKHTRAQLSEARPDALFDDLSDTAAFFGALDLPDEVTAALG